MLKQLEDLSLAAEGRYATAQELQFIRDYIKTVDLRLSAYQKIRDAEDEIIDRLEAKMRQMQSKNSQYSSKDVASVCERDTKKVLRSAIATMLTGDLDRLREHLLLWQRTVIMAFKLQCITAIVHTNMPEIIQQFLTPEEFDSIAPILQLNQAVLAD